MHVNVTFDLDSDDALELVERLGLDNHLQLGPAVRDHLVAKLRAGPMLPSPILDPPIRDIHEADECYQARLAHQADIERFAAAASHRLAAGAVPRGTLRFRHDAPVEVAGDDQPIGHPRPPGVWVPLEIHVTYVEAGVDPEEWEP